MSEHTSYKRISNYKLTLLVELLRALAPLRQSHNGHHLGTQTGAPLFVASQRCRVWAPTARTLFQAVHGPWDAGGAHHVPGCCTQAAETAHPARAGHLHRAAEHHGPAGLEGRWAWGGELESWNWAKEKRQARAREDNEQQWTAQNKGPLDVQCDWGNKIE